MTTSSDRDFSAKFGRSEHLHRINSATSTLATFAFRKGFPGQYSIESQFSRLIEDLEAAGFAIERCIAPFNSKGVFKRVANMFVLARRGGGLLHITGDIHYTALLARMPVVLTVHDCELLNRLSGVRREIARHVWFAWPCRRAAAVTVVSQETKRRLMSIVPDLDERKIVVVPPSIADAFKPVFKPFDAQKPRILQIGTKRNKNLPRLIQALAGLSCKLVIIGELTPDICEQLSQSNIDFDNLAGLTDDEIVVQYVASDIVAFVSIEEGFGMPLIEAQRIGRVIVTSNVSVMPEVAGDQACFVDPNHPSSIRAGFDRVIADEALRNRLIESGFRNAQRFSRKAIAESYLRVYQNVLAACER